MALTVHITTLPVNQFGIKLFQLDHKIRERLVSNLLLHANPYFSDASFRDFIQLSDFFFGHLVTLTTLSAYANKAPSDCTIGKRSFLRTLNSAYYDVIN